MGNSPSTMAVIVMAFNVIAPWWLSRKAVSAASRPVAMRTIDCRGNVVTFFTEKVYKQLKDSLIIVDNQDLASF